MSVQSGGKAVYGATLGILMLETQFPRIPGDVGNVTTWPFPVHYRVVSGATPDRIVLDDPTAMLDAFVAEGQALIRMGCDGIVTNCGFLSLLQNDLADRLEVPVASSALMQIPMITQSLPRGKQVGVLTVSKTSLTPRHLEAAGVVTEVPIVGTDSGRSFSQTFLTDQAQMDVAACRLDMLDSARELTRTHPDVAAIVLECTNMVPFAADIRRATGRPVYSIYTLINWFQSALSPRRFPVDLDDPRIF